MKKTFYFLLLISIGVRLIVLVVLNLDLVPKLRSFVFGGDAIGYAQLAENLINEGILKFDEGGATAYRMPGYPILISLFYRISNGWLFLQLFQIILDIFTIFLVYMIADNITKSDFTAIIAVLFLVLNPLLVLSTITILPETAVICLVTMAMFVLLNFPFTKWSYWVVPVILSIAIYLKPTILPVAIVLCAAYVFYHYKKFDTFILSVRLGLLFCLVFAIMFTPWIARNYSEFEAFIPLTTSNGSNLYGGNNSRSDGGYISEYPYVMAGMSEVESDEFFKKLAIDWIQANPQEFISLLPLKSARFLWPLSLGTTGNISVPTFISVGLFISLLIIDIFVFMGLWTLLATNNYWRVIILASIPIILLLLSLISFGAARFALPAYPSFFILGAIGLENTISTYQQKILKKKTA